MNRDPESIREAIPQDAEAIERIRVAAWRMAYGDFLPRTFLDSLDPLQNISALRDALQSEQGGTLCRVIEVGQEVAGYSILGPPRYDSAPATLELWALNVFPEHWRRGLGRALVRQACMDASVRNVIQLELWCIDGNRRAAELYERSGFSPLGQSRTTTVLTQHPLTEILMNKPLRDASGRKSR